jgi:large subunit ribosomal protein L25
MEEVILKATKRNRIGKHVKELRRDGRLPAVIYGVGVEPTPISLDQREASKILGSLAATAFVTLEVDDKSYLALIREKQRHILLGTLRHVDFQAVSAEEKRKLDVAVVTTGEAPAIAELGGILVSNKETLMVECLPRDLPESISVDISGLADFGDAIYVRDVSPPPNVTLLDDPDEMIVLITTPAPEEEEEVEEEVEEEGMEPEVIERGKREEEDEEEEAKEEE